MPPPTREDEKIMQERKDDHESFITEAMLSLYKSIRDSGAEVVALNIPDERRFEENYSEILPNIDVLNRAYTETCEVTGSRHVDLFEAFGDARAKGEVVYLPADPVHPSAAGVIALADVVEPILIEVFKNRSSSASQ